MKFKVGDNVRCIGDGAHAGAGWELGKVFVINSIGDEISSNPCYFPKSGHGIYGNYLELATPKSMKAPTHLVIWDTENKDPHRFFTSEKEARDFMKELSGKSDVVKDSVILVAIKSAQKVSITKIVRLKNYKI